MKNPIIFYKGEENGIVVEKSNYEYSLFTDQYKKAFEIFKRIWDTQQQMIELESKGKQDTYRGMDNRFSNIISFCGDRGEGKSSCMSSFTAMLTEQEARKSAIVSKLVDAQFVGIDKIELIDFIDPSFFDEQHNVLELLLGRMYTSVNRINSQNQDYETQLYKIRQLREQFQKVKTSLAILHKKDEKNYLENLEELDELAAGIRLKAELDELFRLYLEFVKKERILICIDDMDLNMSQGYKMAELVRKYLIGKYCIILISVKIEQLVDIVAIAMRNELGKDNVSLDYCQLMAQKYVVKLLPQSNRVFMPSGNAIFDRDLYFVDNRNSKINACEKMTVKERIVQLIFQKTGYVFYNTLGVSPIVPTNLRSLRHLSAALLTLPDYRDKAGRDCEDGRAVFKNYFWGTWVLQQLAESDKLFANLLRDYTDSSYLNSFVIEHFSKRVEEKGLTPNAGNGNRFYDLYHAIIKKDNVAVNMSYGDVMYVLWIISRISDDVEINRLVFFIQTVYSMRIYATYNLITEEEVNLYPSQPEDDNIAIHKSDRYYLHVNELQRLINGSYFSFPNTSLLPSENISSKKTAPRDRRIISFKMIRNLFMEMLKGVDEDQNNNIEKLRMCEFLALCISRTTNSKDIEAESSDKGFNRTSMTPTYIGQFSDTAYFAVFDFLQPFYSLCNIEYAYRRFDSILERGEKDSGITEGSSASLYEIALNEPQSLLCQFYKKTGDSLTWKLKHQLISDAIIRNSDVQSAIFDVLIQSRDVHKVSKYKDIIRLAYQDIQNLNIKLYPLIQKEDDKNIGISDPSWLTFEFLTVFTEFLNNVDENTFDKFLAIPKDFGIVEQKNKFEENLRLELLKGTYPIEKNKLIARVKPIAKFKYGQKLVFENSLMSVLTEESYQLVDVNNLFTKILSAYMMVIEATKE